MGEGLYSCIKYMQERYEETLQKSLDKIGLDQQKLKFTNTTIDARVVNSEIRRMCESGQEAIYGYRRFQAINNGSAGLSRVDLGRYVSESRIGNLHKYVKDTDVPQSIICLDAEPIYVLMDLYHAYNRGLRMALASNDTMIRGPPEEIFSESIMRVYTEKRTRNKPKDSML